MKVISLLLSIATLTLSLAAFAGEKFICTGGTFSFENGQSLVIENHPMHGKYSMVGSLNKRTDGFEGFSVMVSRASKEYNFDLRSNGATVDITILPQGQEIALFFEKCLVE